MIRFISFLRLLFMAWLPATLSAAEPAKAGTPMAAGDVRAAQGFYSLVFYYSPDPRAEPEATARTLAAKAFPGVAFSTQASRAPKPPFIGFEEERAPLKNFPVPDAGYFKHAGRGLSDEAIAGMQKTTRATRLVLVVPSDDVWKSGKLFTQLAFDFATATGATIWDSATRECFSREAWLEKRVKSWAADQSVPDLNHQITIHLYQADETTRYLRAITLGMEKFALPDVVIERLAGSDNRPAGNLINLVCQSLAEVPQMADGANRLFRVADLRASELRDHFKKGLEEKATEEVRLALLTGQRQEGDPDNRLIELAFQHSPGKTEDERRNAAFATLWGSKDSIVGVKHDAAIKAASERARARLPALRKAFAAGYAPGERLLLKAPFARDDEGNEWMWVEVMEWSASGEIAGLLQNDPFYIKALRAGAKVRVKQRDVFDYIFRRANGTMEGNETGQLIQKKAGPERKK